MQRSYLPRLWAAVLAIAALLAGTLAAPLAQAGMIDTRSVVEQRESEQQREQLRALLEREEVREQLVQLGVDPVAAQQRVDHLSEREVAELAAHMDELPAGAGVLNVLILGFLVLLATDILGLTDVFPFIRGAGTDY